MPYVMTASNGEVEVESVLPTATRGTVPVEAGEVSQAMDTSALMDVPAEGAST